MPQPEPEYFGDYVGGSGVCWQIQGEFLYIRPSNAEVAFAQVVDGNVDADAAQIPIGATGVVTPFYDPGFRVSAARALGDRAAIGVSYAYFDTTSYSAVFATDTPNPGANPLVRSLVLHPATPNANNRGDWAYGFEEIRFHLADVDYKAALIADSRSCLNVIVGARFASLVQDFNSAVVSQQAPTELMYSRVRYDGGGVRLGLEGERQAAGSGFLVYAKGTASFVAGTFRADYSQFTELEPFIADARWKSNRLVTMLDFELGAGWSSVDGGLRVTAGWMASGWLNTIRVADYIRAVQTSNYDFLDNAWDNALMFDGLVFRAEWRF